MAIVKTVPTEYGVEASVHEIGLVQNDFKEKKNVVILVGYANEEAYRAGAKPLGATQVIFEKTDYVEDLTKSGAYEKILARPEFEGVTTVPD